MVKLRVQPYHFQGNTKKYWTEDKKKKLSSVEDDDDVVNAADKSLMLPHLNVPSQD
jgi:hypothetical protein